MRLLAIILSVYVLALSCFSCADEQVVCNKTQISESLACTENEHHEDEDVCPPFCTCACCKTSIEINIVAPLVSSIKKINPKPQIHFKATIVDMQYAIWQPPQLS